MSVRESYMRQLDVINPNDIPPITVIGNGAIGTGVAIILTKLGASNITLIDGDDVDVHNVSNQYFAGDAVGRNKADALYNEVMRIAPMGIKPYVMTIPEFLTEENKERINTEYVIMCVDGLDTRQDVFNWLQSIPRVKWVFDTRMGAESYEVYTINMESEDDIMQYAESFGVSVAEAPCTSRSVIYTVMRCASLCVRYVKGIIKKEKVPLMYREDLTRLDALPYREYRK